MTKEQAVNYLKSSGFSSEAVAEIILALTTKEELLDFEYMLDTLNDRVDFVFSDGTQKHCKLGALRKAEKYKSDLYAKRHNFHKLIDHADSETYKTICQSVAVNHCFYEDHLGLHILKYFDCDKCPFQHQDDCVKSVMEYLIKGESEG